jgi:hypothetical protein
MNVAKHDRYKANCCEAWLLRSMTVAKHDSCKARAA